MNLYAYHLPPIDFGWNHLKTVSETITNFTHDEEYECKISEFLRIWELSKNLSEEILWEGDFRESPRVFWIPSELKMIFGFVFKQDNNGSTFVVSPVELPFLIEHSMYTKKATYK
jgi:hypothetical protein